MGTKGILFWLVEVEGEPFPFKRKKGGIRWATGKLKTGLGNLGAWQPRGLQPAAHGGPSHRCAAGVGALAKRYVVTY